MFNIESTLHFNIDKLTIGDDFDYVTRTSINQGVLRKTGFVNKENINSGKTWSLGLLQMDFFYRQSPWYAGQFVRKITPKNIIKGRAISFFTTVLNKLSPMLLNVLVRNVNKTFNQLTVNLPVTKDGELDFEFMEQYTDNLESKHIERVEHYLSTTKLNDYELTEEEKDAITVFDSVVWREFHMRELFERIKTKKLPYKAKELPRKPIGENILPCLTASFVNQGLNYYAPKEGSTILKNVISLPSNSDVYRAYFQSNEFTVLSDAYAIEWKYSNENLSDNKYLFTVTCINTVTDLHIYSHKNKLGGWNVVRDKSISLPVKDGKLDYEYMEKLTVALKKLAIKDTVEWTNQELNKLK